MAKATKSVLGRDPFSSLTGKEDAPAPPTPPKPPKKAPEKAPKKKAARARPKKRSARKAPPEAKAAPKTEAAPVRKAGPDPFQRLETRLTQALRSEASEPPALDVTTLRPLVDAVGRALEGVDDLGERVGALEARIDSFLSEAEARLETLSADGELSPSAREQVGTLSMWVGLLKELRKALSVAKLRRSWKARGSRARVMSSLVLEELRQALKR